MSKDAEKYELSNYLIMKIIEQINLATNIEYLIKNLPDRLPVRSASYHHFAAVGAWDFKNLSQFYAYNIPENIVSYYRKFCNHEPHAGVAEVYAKGQPYWYSDMLELRSVAKAGHYELGQISLSILGEGLCLPLFGPNNRKGYIYISFYLERDKFSQVFKHQVHSLAQIFHTRYCVMLEQLNKKVKLTPRQAEVLELVSFGKTNSEIAQILDLSTSTVSGYLKNIFLKLEVSDRVSAAMRAQTIRLDNFGGTKKVK